MKKKYNKINGFIYLFAGFFVTVFLKIKGHFKVTKKEKIEKGSLIIAPHRTYYDMLFVGMAIYPKKVHFVTSTYWYRNKKLGKFLDILGVIPRDQFKNDANSILKIGQALKDGENVAIFPEGQMSPFGNSLFLPAGLDKLVSLFKPNVYFIECKGLPLISTKFNKKFGKGRIDAEITKLVGKDEIDGISVEEINSRIKTKFKETCDFRDDILYNPRYNVKKKKKAEGLENIVLFCPKCCEKNTLYTSFSKVNCECGLELEFNKKDYTFKENDFVKDIRELYDFNRKTIEKLVDDNVKIENKVKVTYYDENFNEVDLCDGIVKMDTNSISIIPNEGDNVIALDMKKVINLVVTLNKSFEIPTQEKTYRVYPMEGKDSMLYWTYFNILKDKNNG